MDDTAPARNDPVNSSVSGGQNSPVAASDAVSSSQPDPQGAPSSDQTSSGPTYHSVLGKPEPQAPPLKEQEPIGITSQDMPEIMQPAEQEPQLHPEVAEAGVETIPDAPELSIEDHRAGLTHSGENTPHHTAPTGAVILPMTPEEAEEAAKKEPVENSRKWLGVLIMKHIMTLHRKLIGGKTDAT